MKYKRLSLIFLLAFNILFGCNKNKDNQGTELHIDVIDESDNKVPGASVTLSDNRGNFIENKIADSYGYVVFSHLPLATYKYDAVIGCKNNKNDLHFFTLDLPYKSWYLPAHISENGVLKIINNSSDSFYFEINVLNIKFSDDIPDHQTYFLYPDIGLQNLYTVIKGASGTGKDSSIQISCTDTTIINLPY